MRHKELKDHLRKENTVCVPQGKRNPVSQRVPESTGTKGKKDEIIFGIVRTDGYIISEPNEGNLDNLTY